MKDSCEIAQIKKLYITHKNSTCQEGSTAGGGGGALVVGGWGQHLLVVVVVGAALVVVVGAALMGRCHMSEFERRKNVVTHDYGK